jgi:predicted O-methyltransferase YrrM
MNIKYKIKNFLKKVHIWYPLWDLKELVVSKQKLKLYQKEALRIRESSSLLKTNEEAVELISKSNIFSSQQNGTEILALMDILEQRKPKVVCEIGSAGGGTLFLFSRVSHPEGRFISVDIRYPTKAHKNSLPYLMGSKQSLILIEAKSQDPKTVERVKKCLCNNLIDFLFIDGDHSYEGVSEDFAIYSQMVKPNGIIAFHDIHPDYFLHYGKETYAYTGKVPFFWQDLVKKNGSDYIEFIENTDQDGRGIGVLFNFKG